MRIPKLSPRLEMIFNLVPKTNCVADIGTDHAYLPVHLINSGKCNKCIASDVVEGPVKKAQKNINRFNMQDTIETRIGNGLETLKYNEAKCIIIAGMGGVLISEILSRSSKNARDAELLILQPMYAHEALREWLYNNGFDIIDEKLSKEDNRIYNALCVRYTGEKKQDDLIYYYIGRKLIEKKDDLLEKYLEQLIDRYNKIIIGINQSEAVDEILYKKNSEIVNGMKEILESLR